ncbi:MAG: DNA translocase FtsK 4TM domain-containing protein, partial [Ilumatobacteraceae bacterium]
MTTWGPSKKQTAKSRTSSPAKRGSSTSRTPPRTPAPSGRSTASTSAARQGSGRAATSSATPPGGSSRREQATGELRGAVEGREHEFIGIGLIAAGVLLGLAIYLNLAGPLGRGIETLTGWLVGLGRYAIPVVLVAAGVAFVRKGQSSSPVRLAIGWTLVGLAAVGICQVLNGSDDIGDLDDLGRSGGLLGALVGGPLEALLAPAGGIVLLLVAGIGGALLITSTSVKTMASKTGSGVGRAARPIVRAGRQALRDLSSLSSDGKDDDDARDTDTDATTAMAPGQALPPPTVYDAGDDFTEIAPSKPARRMLKPEVPGEPDLGPPEGVASGQWTLPPVSFLHRTGAQTINRAEVEARGRVLQESLGQHGVDTSLVGMTVGPTVTRYELELGPGVKVARVTSLQRDIAYAMAATDVRILAPIPGRSAIGVEVPNHTRQLVALGDLMVSAEAKAATGPLEVAIGKDIAGKSVFLDLATTPHLLIAGATGAGKSSGIN